LSTLRKWGAVLVVDERHDAAVVPRRVYLEPVRRTA
jgi:hypothetical protein